MKELKKLPDRAELRAAALKRLEKPSSRILSGVVLESKGHISVQLNPNIPSTVTEGNT